MKYWLLLEIGTSDFAREWVIYDVGGSRTMVSIHFHIGSVNYTDIVINCNSVMFGFRTLTT